MEYVKCFIFGGALCVIAQIIIDKTKLTPARILSAYVCSGVLLTALGLYKPLVEIFHCGATIPLTGFGYALAEGVKSAIDSSGFIGIFTGGVTAAAGGIAASVFFGLLMAIIFKPKQK